MGAFETGRYRNVFAEIGKSEKEIREKIESAVSVFFYGSEEERIYHPVGEDMGYLEDTGNKDVRTEGMSYGMMLCVQLDWKEEFDRIWKWAKTYMYMEEGENEGYFAWSCQVDGEKNAWGPAPDGEEYFAMALFFASHRWGDGEGIFHYSREARNILKACLHKGEDGRPGAPMWNRENGQILFVPGADFTDPSYHLPHFYELFALWADEEDREFWRRAADASRRYLAKACHPVTGLNPEYSGFDGAPLSRKLRWSDTHSRFYSDAYRTAANIGLDYVWFGKDKGQYAAPLRQMRFLGTDLEAARCVFETDGTPLDRTVLHPVGLLAAAAQGALTVSCGEKPCGEVSCGEKPVGEMFCGDMSVGEMSWGDMSCGEKLGGEVSCGEKPVGEMFCGDMSVGEMSWGEVFCEEKLGGEVSCEEKLGREVSCGEKPVGDMSCGEIYSGKFDSSESDWNTARKWVEWFWNQPLRRGNRRYYDNCLYLFALLALSGNYRIYGKTNIDFC